jgi:cytosine/adenosine deaminase-related metal-dependent hydrolase
MGFSIPNLLRDYGLLKSDILLSHGTGSTDEEFKLLKDAGVYVSCTPGTESQMAHGDLVGFRPDVLGSLGSDCHSNNHASILHAIDTGLAVARALRNHKLLSDGHFPRYVEPTTLQAFNLATVSGAKAVGMGDTIGRLEVGRQADILVFGTDSPGMTCVTEHDPLTAIVRHANVSDIETTIIGGRILKHEGKLVDIPVREGQIKVWDGSARVNEEVVKDGKLTWAQVRGELRRSRAKIQKSIEGVNIELAKEKVLEMWGHRDGENVLK